MKGKGVDTFSLTISERMRILWGDDREVDIKMGKTVVPLEEIEEVMKFNPEDVGDLMVVSIMKVSKPKFLELVL